MAPICIVCGKTEDMHLFNLRYCEGQTDLYPMGSMYTPQAKFFEEKVDELHRYEVGDNTYPKIKELCRWILSREEFMKGKVDNILKHFKAEHLLGHGAVSPMGCTGCDMIKSMEENNR